jgi:hypothetical protein
MLAVTPRPQSMMIDRPAIAKCDDVGKKDAPSPEVTGRPLVPSKTSFAFSLLCPYCQAPDLQ